jgi:hypothetical protein
LAKSTNHEALHYAIFSIPLKMLKFKKKRKGLKEKKKEKCHMRGVYS